MARFLHYLSKDARKRIIQVMLESRSQRELAEEIGITPAAVSKYLSGKTHPSDEVLRRIIQAASRDEIQEISKIIAADLVNGINDYMAWAIDNRALDPEIVKALEHTITRARLLVMAERMSIT